MRIQKYLSQKGIMSRREAEDFMTRGLIKVNGKIVIELGTKIDPDKDIVEVIEDDSTPQKETYAIYKPAGVVSSEIESEGKTLSQAFPKLSHLKPVGRLDKASEGLLLLSNDGIITKIITGKEKNVEKEYIVEAREDIIPGMIARLEKGVNLVDGPTLPAKATKIDQHTISITLTEGRKHQVRRMCDAVKLTINSLKRVRIGHITLNDITDGSSRKLTAEEVSSFKAL
jgi:23S rRNA pseudouridine2605 synthase